jgi:hypothetical protein
MGKEMKQANAVRVGDRVSLNYGGQWLSFDWPHSDLYVSTDADGEVWAYFAELEHDASGFFSPHGDNKSVYMFSTATSGWKDSVVEYTIK